MMAISSFLECISAQTTLYVLTCIVLWQLQERINGLLTYSGWAILTAAWLYNASMHWVAERKIVALGAHAPTIRADSPGNVALLARNVHAFLNHNNHLWWWRNFASVATPRNPVPWTMEANLLGERVVITADEENIKAVLAADFHSFGKGEAFRQEWKPFLGLSIFTTDGEMWHDSRQLLRPQFIKDRVSDLKVFERHLGLLLQHLGGSHAGATVRADDLFFRFALDAATDFLLGHSVESLKNPQVRFAEAFAQVQHTQGVISRAGPLRSVVPKKKYYEAIKVMDGFVSQFIEEALQLSPEELEHKTKTDEGYTFLHALASYTRDRSMLRDSLVAVLLAGRDTTASSLSWLMYELSKAPDVVRKLREEIVSHVGMDRTPTYADLKSMRYLQHTLNEILRIYPLVPYNVRVALKNTALPRGGGPDGTEPIGIAAGTPVGYSPFILQHRKDIYPPVSEKFADPELFAPERWDNWVPRPWTYIPFNGGPRICIGQQFALTEMAYTLVRILQTFDRIECRTPDFPRMRTEIVLQPADGVFVALHRSEKGGL